MSEDDKDRLSADEIETLLGDGDEAGENSEANASEDGNENATREYDFLSQERAVSGRMAGLYAINERFLRSFRGNLSNLLHRAVEVSVIDIVTIKGTEYIASLGTPSCINVFRLRPLHGTALCIIDTELVFALVDTMFGGEGSAGENKEEKQEFTQMETRIVHLVLETLFSDLAFGWKSIYPVDIEFQGTEINPQLISVSSPNEVFIVKRFRMELEDAASAEFHIAIPFSMIEPIRTVLEAGAQGDGDEVNERWAGKLREEVFDSEIKLTGALADTEMSLDEIIKLKKGDVVPVEMFEHVTLLAGEIPTFRAKFGVSNNHCAVKVLGKVNRE